MIRITPQRHDPPPQRIETLKHLRQELIAAVDELAGGHHPNPQA